MDNGQFQFIPLWALFGWVSWSFEDGVDSGRYERCTTIIIYILPNPTILQSYNPTILQPHNPTTLQPYNPTNLNIYQRGEH